MKNTKERIEMMTEKLMIKCNQSKSQATIKSEIKEFANNVVKLFGLPQVSKRIGLKRGSISRPRVCAFCKRRDASSDVEL